MYDSKQKTTNLFNIKKKISKNNYINKYNLFSKNIYIYVRINDTQKIQKK